MNDETIRAIAEEIAPQLVGRLLGKVFQLSRTSVAVDFRLSDGRYLFISVDPSLDPRLYLVERRVRELEKQSLQPSPFVLALKKQLSGATLVSIKKDDTDRIVRFSFEGRNAVGDVSARTLVAQLTGRAANLLLLNEHGYVIDTLRNLRGEGQEAGEFYKAPPAQTTARAAKTEAMTRGSFASLSEAADDYYSELERKRAFEAQVARERSRLNKEIAQRTKLKRHLEGDLKAHGDAGEHKRMGDLLLANIATARRSGSRVVINDYYAEDAPEIEVEVDENSSLQEEAARRFSRYTKARRASQEISRRLATIEKELEKLEAQRAELESISQAHDGAALGSLTGKPEGEDDKQAQKKKQAEQVAGARRFTSSDGYEILVGRAARDNDNLTFRVARPQDLWLHAADYPGSHVIVRNPSRAEVPHRTVIEAAQLAAHFSQARNDTKVTVHYTQRKFLSKPKGSAPGLVRLSSFRSITVEPKKTASE